MTTHSSCKYRHHVFKADCLLPMSRLLPNAAQTESRSLLYFARLAKITSGGEKREREKREKRKQSFPPHFSSLFSCSPICHKYAMTKELGYITKQLDSILVTNFTVLPTYETNSVIRWQIDGFPSTTSSYRCCPNWWSTYILHKLLWIGSWRWCSRFNCFFQAFIGWFQCVIECGVANTYSSERYKYFSTRSQTFA